MKSIHIILNCLIILSQQCSNLMDNKLYITPTQLEVIKIPLSQIFISNDYDSITFQPVVNFLTIAPPLQEVEKASKHRVQGKTISIKVLKLTTGSEPQHLIAILRFSEGIYYCEYDVKQYSSFPLLDDVFRSTERVNSQCYDIALMETLVITECSDNDGDYLSFLVINQPQIYYLAIEKPKDSFRKLDMIDQYLLRGTVDKLELYEEKELKIELINSLDQAVLRELLKKESFELQIKDFKTHTNGWISILNKDGEIIVVYYKENNWQLIRIIETGILNVHSYDFDAQRNVYVVVSNNQIFTKTINAQEFTISVNSKPTDKVILQQSSILLFQDKTIALYSQELYNYFSGTLTNLNYYINSYPNSLGFLVIDDEQFYKYVVNTDYQLQFSADTLPIDPNYRVTKIISKTNCVVEIYYTGISYDSTLIYSTQVPQALIAESIFQDNVEVKLKPIYQGSNLKYQFKEHELLKLKVEQFQGIEILNIDDMKDVIYRKSLSNINNPYVQIIQQHSNNQIGGFTCEVVTKLKLNCQSMFDKKQFEQLKDSDKQLWWFNYNSIFLAILQGQTIKIYCVFYQQNKFDLLTTITLEENVKQIVTDGYHLIVNLDSSIKIYEISVENKEVLLQTQKNIVGDIYASPAQSNLFIIEQNSKLKVYSFEKEKLNLIWYTDTTDYDQKNIIILRNHFARLYKTKNLQEYTAIVFNIQNLNNIYLEKQIKFNKNSIIKLNQIEVNLQQSLFYVVGQTDQKYNLLIYKIDETSFNSMFLSLDNTSTAQFSISNSYCFITDTTANKQVQQNYYITGENFVQTTLKDNYKQVQYSKEISLSVTVKSDLSNEVNYVIPALVVNRGVSLFQTKDSLNLTYKANSTQTNCIKLDQSWYSGQAFDITQNKDQEKIKFINTLSKQAETLEFSPFIQEFNSDTLVQLLENKIILVKKSDLTKSEFTQLKTYKLKTLLLIQDQNIYVEAAKETQNYLKIIQCQNSVCTLLEDELQFPTSINKVFLHNNNFFIYSSQMVYVYDTKGNPQKLSEFEQFKKITIFKQPYFVEFQYLHDNVYQIISVDIRGNAQFSNAEISRTSAENQIFPQDIVNILKLNKLYVSSYSVCVGLVLRKNEILIVFNNIATFSFKFEFDCHAEKLCELKYFELNGVYQQYGGWIMFNIYPIIYTNENILSMVYWAYNHFELLLFDLETTSSKENPKQAIAHLNTPSSKVPGEFFQIQSFVYSQKGELHLLTSADDKAQLQHYLLQRSPQVCTNEKKITDMVKLTLHNSINNYEANLNITISEDQPTPPLPPDDDDPKKFPIWAIILIVIGILGIGSLTFYCWKKNKSKVDHENGKVLLE